MNGWTPVELEPGVWVNEDSTVLVSVHPNGTLDVKLRDDSDATWGPPIDVERES